MSFPKPAAASLSRHLQQPPPQQQQQQQEQYRGQQQHHHHHHYRLQEQIRIRKHPDQSARLPGTAAPELHRARILNLASAQQNRAAVPSFASVPFPSRSGRLLCDSRPHKKKRTKTTTTITTTTTAAATHPAPRPPHPPSTRRTRQIYSPAAPLAAAPLDNRSMSAYQGYGGAAMPSYGSQPPMHQQPPFQGNYHQYEETLVTTPSSRHRLSRQTDIRRPSRAPPPQAYNGYQPQGQPSPQSPYGYSPQHPPPQQHYGYHPGPPPTQQHPQQSPQHYPNQYNQGPPANYQSRPGAGPPPQAAHGFAQGRPQDGAQQPPSTPQHFGSGAPQNYSFRYSQCTGRRKALLIGINYFGQRGQLRGCINDVRNMTGYLAEHFGYKREDMVILTDDQQNPMSQPTKQNILRAMHWLVKDARPNDSLFFHYSGHGGQTKDLDGDEPDGYDEVIYPVDFRQHGHVTDDEMHRIMVQPLVAGVRLTAIFDSCHSGTALDLPYIYSTQGILKEPNLAKEAGQGLLGVISSYSQGDLGGMGSHFMSFLKKATSGEEAHSRAIATKTSPADVIMWSGSKDDQTSADATIASQATGAMSWAFINALKKNPQQSYVQLLNSIRDELSTKYTQKPQLSCSHPLNTNLLFVM